MARCTVERLSGPAIAIGQLWQVTILGDGGTGPYNSRVVRTRTDATAIRW